MSSSHDGSHITDFNKFFEWWYFDFDLEDGYHIYIVWHSPMFCLKEPYGTLLVRINSPDSKIVDKKLLPGKAQWINSYRYHSSKVFQSVTKCNISFPSGFIKEVHGNYLINVTEKDLHIDLKLKRLSPPISIDNNLIFQTKNKEEYFKWFLPLPKAIAKGKIILEGKSIILTQAVSYHDHNWGNINLIKYLRGWIWCRVFFNDFTFIFGDVHAKVPEKSIQFLLIVDRNGGRIDTSSFKINYKHFENQNQYKLQIPTLFSIEFENQGTYKIDFRNKKELVIEEAPLGYSNNNFLNVWLVKLYYLFRLYHMPNQFKKWYGRLIYSQSEIIGEVFKNDRIMDRQSGTIEVMSFAD